MASETQKRAALTLLVVPVVFAFASLIASLVLDLAFHDGARALTLHVIHPAGTFQLHLIAHGAVALLAFEAALLLSAVRDTSTPGLVSTVIAGLLNGFLGSEPALMTSAAYGPLLGALVFLGSSFLAFGAVCLIERRKDDRVLSDTGPQ